jgi:hypothetical protein
MFEAQTTRLSFVCLHSNHEHYLIRLKGSSIILDFLCFTPLSIVIPNLPYRTILYHIWFSLVSLDQNKSGELKWNNNGLPLLDHGQNGNLRVMMCCFAHYCFWPCTMVKGWKGWNLDSSWTSFLFIFIFHPMKRENASVKTSSSQQNHDLELLH